MSFSITKTQDVNITDPITGLVMSTQSQSVSYDVSIDSVQINSDNSAIAFYTVTSGTNSASNYVAFSYSGTGDPNTEAESAVKTYLTS